MLRIARCVVAVLLILVACVLTGSQAERVFMPIEAQASGVPGESDGSMGGVPGVAPHGGRSIAMWARHRRSAKRRRRFPMALILMVAARQASVAEAQLFQPQQQEVVGDGAGGRALSALKRGSGFVWEQLKETAKSVADAGDVALLERALRSGTINNDARLYALKLLFTAKPGVIARSTLSASVLFFLGYAGPAVGLQMLGFGAGGVIHGSVAAAIQSTFPLVAAGSWFAWAQSVTMSGAAWTPQLGAAFASAGTWLLGGRRFAPITSDRQLFRTVLNNGLFDSKLRGLLASGA